MTALLLPIYTGLIFLGPLPFAVFPLFFVESTLGKAFVLPLSVALYVSGFLLAAGGVSRVYRKAILPGKFPRDLKDPVYGPRRLHALGWSCFYYFTPLYYVVLSFPRLRNIVFRWFGYTGDLDFNLAPDAWVRDLPILQLGEKSYSANKCTLGTNMCLSDGTTLVDRVTLKPQAMVGHAVLIGPGATLEESSEVGVQSAIGIRARLHPGACVGGICAVNHGASVGAKADIGTRSYLGIRSKIGAGVRVPAGANIPGGAEILTQEDCDRYYSSETAMLEEAAESAFTEPLSPTRRVL